MDFFCHILPIGIFHFYIDLSVCRTLDSHHALQQVDVDDAEFFTYLEPQLFASAHSIHFPLPDSGPLMEKVLILIFFFKLSTV